MSWDLCGLNIFGAQVGGSGVESEVGEGCMQPGGHVCVCVCLGGWGPSLSLPAPQERYYVLYVRPSLIHRRRFDPKGNEIEPNFSATRKVNTGFLLSSYSRCLRPSPLRPTHTVACLCLQGSRGP